MNLLTVLFAAVGLAADAFAVSVANGIALKRCYKLYCSLIFGFYFGLFQFIMPIIGFYLGQSFTDEFEDFSHWIVFGLLALIGVKMIYETLSNREEDETVCDTRQILSVKNMCVLAIATSIDACALGVSFALVRTPVLVPSIVIGVVAFVFSGVGVFLGNKLGGFFHKSAGIVGGVILIGIGIKILLT
ncbi:MAG: manganese efflux pump MntP family protein [Clostridiales bacterium]|jgi:putative Mn2+ efflux pump MntP|nr:manganese efflux pump MntP family protein [Clostridiales bacterium]